MCICDLESRQLQTSGGKLSRIKAGIVAMVHECNVAGQVSSL